MIINVLGHDISVIPDVDDKNNYGEFHGGICEHRICVRSDMTKKEQDYVLLHEIIHAILHITGVNCMLTDEVEETVVKAVSQELFSIGYRLRRPRTV